MMAFSTSSSPPAAGAGVVAAAGAGAAAGAAPTAERMLFKLAPPTTVAIVPMANQCGWTVLPRMLYAAPILMFLLLFCCSCRSGGGGANAGVRRADCSTPAPPCRTTSSHVLLPSSPRPPQHRELSIATLRPPSASCSSSRPRYKIQPTPTLRQEGGDSSGGRSGQQHTHASTHTHTQHVLAHQVRQVHLANPRQSLGPENQGSAKNLVRNLHS